MATPEFIQALQNPDFYPHPVSAIKLVETHISWILLTGEYAYKIKKPVNLGFLDFSSLEQREYFCHHELELNQRLAPQIYLEVVPIGGTISAPKLGSEPAIEFAVKMKQFSPESQLNELLKHNALTSEHIDELAETIAEFHSHIEISGSDSSFGTTDKVWEPVAENFAQIRPLINNKNQQKQLDQLDTWSKQAFSGLQAAIEQRKQQGYIRNCHGDLHLANIAVIEGKAVPFDCIEFNETFRWIDVISEVAFTYMDLTDQGRSDLAARLLDRYLQHTGDYQGLKLFPFYIVYRAMVRAKVAAIRASQSGVSENEKRAALKSFQNYIDLALRFTQKQAATLYIAHGVSGSGKTTLTQPLLEKYGLIRLRSDIERKRLFGLSANAKTEGATNQSLYSSNTSEQTYQHLCNTARQLLEDGFSVVIDATFLKQEQRQIFFNLAKQVACPFIILHFYAEEALLKRWIIERAEAGKDASEATVEVLEHQLKTEEPITKNEANYIISIDTSSYEATNQLLAAIAEINNVATPLES